MFNSLKLLKNKLADNKYINNLIIFYIFAVLFYQITYMIVPVRQFYRLTYLYSVSQFLAVAGFAIAFWDLLTKRIFLKTKYTYFLLGLLAIMAVSALLSIKTGLVSNVKSIIWQSAQMLVLFPMSYRISKEDMAKLLKKSFLVLSAIFITSDLIALYHYYTLTHYITIYEKAKIRQGFYGGRLFGLYSSPHFSSVFMFIMIFATIYFLINTKRTFERILYIFAITVYFAYIVASGTRSVLVGFVCTTAVIAFLLMYKILVIKNRFIGFVRVSVSILVSIALAFGAVSIYKITDKTQKSILALTIQKNNNANKPDKNEDKYDENSEFLDLPLERTDTGKGHDISNGRFAIWRDYVQILSGNTVSLIFGKSPGNYMKYIKENFPGRFIVKYIKKNYPVMFAKGLIYDTHNAYLGAFASTGLLGLLLLMIFLVCGFVRSVRYILKSGKISSGVFITLAIILFILSSSFFDSDLFFKCTSTSVIFWLTTGILLKITEPVSEQQSSVEATE